MRAARTFASAFQRIVQTIRNALASLKASASPTEKRAHAMNEALSALLRSGPLDETDEDGKAKSPEERLIDSLDAAALKFSEIMLNDQEDENGNFRFDLDTRLEVFKLIRDWVATRRRTDISDPNEDQSGVEKFKKMIQDGKAENKRVFVKEGVVAPVVRRVGRPTKAEKAEYDRLERERAAKIASLSRDDDSALAKALVAAKRRNAQVTAGE